MTAPKRKTSPLREAEENAKRYGQEYRSALAVREALLTRLHEGDPTVTDQALRDARDAVDWSSARASAALRAVANAAEAEDRIRAQASPDIAQAVLAFLQEHAASLGAFNVPMRLGEPSASASAVPAIFVTQRKSTRWDLRTGTGSGECLLYFVQGEGSVFDSARVLRDLRDLARSEGVMSIEYGSVRPVKLDDGLTRTGKLVMVQSLRPAIPTLAGEPRKLELNSLSRIVQAQVMERSGITRARGATSSFGDVGARVSLVRCTADSPTLTDTTKDSDGLVRRYFAVPLSVQCAAMEAEDLQASTAAAVGELAGRFVAGVGRVESACLTDIAPLRNGRAATARIVTVSRAA